MTSAWALLPERVGGHGAAGEESSAWSRSPAPSLWAAVAQGAQERLGEPVALAEHPGLIKAGQEGPP